LCGDVQVSANLWQIYHRKHNFFEILFRRVTGNELYPFDAVDFTYHFKEVGKAIGFIARFVFVSVDSLAKQGNLFDTILSKASGLLDYRLGRA
jgi:hypothetical protein